MSYEVEFASTLFSMEGKGGWTFAPVPESRPFSHGGVGTGVPKAVRRGKGHGDTVHVVLRYGAL